MEREQLQAVIEDSWRQLDATIAGLDETALIEPGVVEQWSVRDLIGHVTAWEQMALRHLEQGRRGETPTGLNGTTLDDYNAREARTCAQWSLQRVQREAIETRERLRAALMTVTGAEWATVYGEAERAASLGDWVGNALGGSAGQGTHATEHADHIRAWRERRGA